MEQISKKKNVTILGIGLWELLSYFILYSIAGFFVETIFAIVRYGVFESRQSFVYGPFCTLFFGGFVIGSITEYLVSLIGELILHVKWWDYSNLPLNINGRICFYYSIFWGILAIFLMKAIQPQVRKFMALILRKFNLSTIRTIILVLTIFIAIDCIISAYAINMFRIRMIAINDLNVAHKDEIIELNLKLNKSKIHSFLIHYFFNDKKMIRTYPNLKQEKLDGTIVYFKDLLPDIKPYYYKFVAKDFYK